MFVESWTHEIVANVDSLTWHRSQTAKLSKTSAWGSKGDCSMKMRPHNWKTGLQSSFLVWVPRSSIYLRIWEWYRLPIGLNSFVDLAMSLLVSSPNIFIRRSPIGLKRSLYISWSHSVFPHRSPNNKFLSTDRCGLTITNNTIGDFRPMENPELN